MNKRSLFVIAAFFGVCISALAQTQLSDGLGLKLRADGALDSQSVARAVDVAGPLRRAAYGYPVLALSDDRLFSFANASFSWMEATPRGVIPTPSSAEAQPRKAMAMRDRDLSARLEDERPNPIYTGGEVGFMYGRSTGKYGGSVEQGYVLGVIGNDKFQVTAGASYEQSTVRFPRWGR